MVDSTRERDDPLGIWKGGSAQAVGLRGVWVPDGMTGEMVLAGAKVLEDEFGVDPYTSRTMARKVWAAIEAVRATPEAHL